MKQLLIAANWKSNKTIEESNAWFGQFSPRIAEFKKDHSELTVVLCAPYTDLYILKNQITQNHVPLVLGAQDVSPFPEGAYTGQISAKMVSGLVDWVIIGHSERRKYFHESDGELFDKVSQVKQVGIKVIYCISDQAMPVPTGVDVIAYEPIWAIGTGKTDSPQNANAVLESIKQKTHVEKALYGGSVTAENVAQFIAQPAIDGVLIGGASLKPESFMTLISNALESI